MLIAERHRRILEMLQTSGVVSMNELAGELDTSVVTIRRDLRALAADEGANPLTVAKAYQGFQDEGLIVVKRGVGMFVAPGAASRLRNSERETFIKSEWPKIRDRMARLGIDPAELMMRA